MAILQQTSQKLVLRSGAITLNLDRDRGRTTLQRKIFIWRLKPTEAQLSDIMDVAVDAAVDRASGVEIWRTILIMQSGVAWAFPAVDKSEAESNADVIRRFLGIAGSKATNLS